MADEDRGDNRGAGDDMTGPHTTIVACRSDDRRPEPAVVDAGTPPTHPGRCAYDPGMSEPAPFFIVGVPRSGTTLLRQMLRGHPSLAVPPESHFVPAALTARSGAAALDLILGDEHFTNWQVDAADVRRRAAASDMTPASAVRVAFETYAQAQGRPRWGDKTPAYVLHMPLLAQAFPGARFVHIIRDGRDVAVSWREARFGPGDVLLSAHQWRRMIRHAEADARRLPGGSLLEVRYANLVAQPREELARIIEFLGETMHDDMLDYTERSAADLPQVPAEHRHLLEPPRQHVRDWRASCTPDEQVRVEAIVAPTMRRLRLGPVPRTTAWQRADAELRLLPRRLRNRAAWLLKLIGVRARATSP
jgi:hypothetical protein